jgi:hypothetical protein
VISRLARLVLGLALVAPPALTVLPSAGAAAGPAYTIKGPSRFSPNGDGVQDTLRLRYKLAERAHVRLTIGPASRRVTSRRVDLGMQPAGVHTWTWNGRNQSGKVVPDQAYVIRLFDSDPAEGFPTARASEKVQVDTTFSPTLVAPTFGAGPGAPARVYPRTTVVTDTLPLQAHVWDNKVGAFELVIRNARGRVVRRADLDEGRLGPAGASFGTGRTVEWAAVRGGRPLPKGRYTAVAVGSDLAGNTGRSTPLRIWVSDDELEWQERTETVTPVGSPATEPCAGSGCGDFQPCGTVVPSALFADGLSYRSAECTGEFRYSLATRTHVLPVPEATGVRGIAEAKVALTGAPTTAGESDVGDLVLSASSGASGASVRASTGGETAWVTNPYGGAGRVVLDEDGDDLVIPPQVRWTFTTRGSDWVDVDRFTVSYRFLAPA